MYLIKYQIDHLDNICKSIVNRFTGEWKNDCLLVEDDGVNGFTYKLNLTPELSFMYNKFNTDAPVNILRKSDSSSFLIQIDFHLKGQSDIVYLPEPNSQIGKLTSKNFNVLLSNSYLDCELKYHEDQDHHNFSIVANQDYIRRNFLDLMNLKEELHNLLTYRDKLYLGGKVQLNVVEIIHSIITDLNEEKRNYPLLKAKVDQILALYLEYLNDYDFKSLRFKDVDSDLLNHAIQVINEHINEVITVEGLAEELEISSAKLKKLFADNLDISVGRYIRKSKLKKLISG
ncbi:hypothetical protein [Mangrovivirga cuniculi]|uniref:HTH araC/xylS-type domain-containing protein n=1 Tax=Mangrovivirga cuniculi TaxID=2715131 RepID=A0A4D7K2P0_9BACT|nr:hypothetical protein [Mangrovivirga cuniculi]QCK15144.1 hypothetical protein DCC35_10500 [Mangrovivirga cuniculi]